MTQEGLRYDRMVEAALRSVVREALTEVAAHGLPVAHHFYLTFRTDAPGVNIPGVLRRQYPREMTIVIQHQYEDLRVDPDKFSITLSFNNQPSFLEIPMAALTAFVDPSVKFGLQFNVSARAGPEDGAEDGEDMGEGPGGAADEARNVNEDAPIAAGEASESAEEAEEAEEAEKVVTLDRFRRKT